MGYPDIIALTEPKSPVAEIYRTLRTNIMFASYNKEVKAIAVTSPLTNDGKSTVTSNLAITMAQSGSKVLLVDGDLRNPSIHKMFSMKNNIGLTNILAGSTLYEDSVVSHPGLANLDFILSGPKPPNPSELLGLPRMKALLKTIKSRYDYILIDTPPVLIVTDGTLISSVCDGVVLVISSGKTTIENAQKSKEHLKNVGSCLLGVVLNKVKSDKLEEYYVNNNYYSNRLSKTKEPGRKSKSR